MMVVLHPSETYHGLTQAQAIERKNTYGPNALPPQKPKNFLVRVWGIVSEPMMVLLVITSVIYLVIGDRLQGLVIFCSIIPITIIEFLQEKRTDNALAALGKLRVEECQVYRDGKVIKISSHELVPGDLVYLTAGDKVPADGVVVFTPGMLIDESILTGESAPVEKSEYEGDAELLLGDAMIADTNKNTQVFQGAMVVQGEARVFITHTGAQTEYGKLGKLLDAIEINTTPLQQRIEGLVKKLAIAAVTIAVLIGIVLTTHFGFTHGLLAALTVAIAIIPEEFPIVFSVFLIMGVMRMTKRRAVVRQMALVETLGSATVICTDKTGTLTQGTLKLTAFYHNKNSVTVINESNVSDCKQLIFDALLAVEQVATDPIEVEVQRLAKVVGLSPETIFTTYVLKHDSSFDAATKLVQHAWEDTAGNVYQHIAGAPEVVLARSAADTATRAQAQQAYQDFARQGFRVIGIGKKKLDAQATFVDSGWEFSGLLAMVDPPREGVKAAVAEAYAAGIKLIMITGDNELTALHLASLIGLKTHRAAVHGSELDALSDEQLQELVEDATVFTRVRPEQKYRIVEALQKNNEVVAMTGDGVNDAPALKKADIGIAMGERGTEVARAAAGMVLLDDNFSTIMGAVEEGRRIYDNLRRAFVFLFSLHIPIVGMAVFPLFFGQDLFFTPLQIIFLELFGDPASVIGFERDLLRRGAMESPPRPRNEPLIKKNLWGVVALFGLSIFALTLACHLIIAQVTGSIELARTLAFTVLVFSQITLILFSRDWQLVKTNKVLLTIAFLTLSFLTMIIFIYPLTHIFNFVVVSFKQYAYCVVGSTAAMFLVSRIGRRLAKI